MITIICAIAALVHAANAATCGSTEFFEYKFTPIKVAPVNEADYEKANGRCGTFENHCEVMIQLYGDKRCSEGVSGVQLIAPPDKNVVEGSEFSPKFIDWTGHAQWLLSEAKVTPFSVQVCDKDPAFRGGNDQIIHAQFQDITPGCRNYRHQDENPEHPWFIEYELCCRPLKKGEQQFPPLKSQDEANIGGSIFGKGHKPGKGGKVKTLKEKFEKQTEKIETPEEKTATPPTAHKWSGKKFSDIVKGEGLTGRRYPLRARKTPDRYGYP